MKGGRGHRWGALIVCLALVFAHAASTAEPPRSLHPAFTGSGPLLPAALYQPDDTPCDDGLACTIDDRYVDGRCVGAAIDCDDGLPCTADACSRVTGQCRHEIDDRSCLINGACHALGEEHPENSCQICEPRVSRTRWSNGRGCDDGDPCTMGDHCSQGVCLGTYYSCSDGRGCTVDRCDGFGGCRNAVIAGQCLVNGICVPGGSAHPVDPCRACEPTVNPRGWSAVSNRPCMGGVCVQGRCSASLAIKRGGSGYGNVLGRGLECGMSCTQSYAAGTQLILEARPEPGSVFAGWGGPCTGTGPCRVEVRGMVNVFASFAAAEGR